MSAAHKYLRDHADRRGHLINTFPVLADTRHVLAIPCYDEASDFLDRLVTTQFVQEGALLVAIVVNEPEGEPSDLNRQLLSIFDDQPLIWQQGGMRLVESGAYDQKWLVIDCCHPGLPVGGGVGTARKIAADVVLALREQGKISVDWLHCSDADAHLPDNYFSALDDRCSAAVFDFVHSIHPENVSITVATRVYETALRYYVAGLAWAGSPYAFHTIGSTLAVNLNYYPQVRGFPQRAAAEDFYLLNKLSKLAPIQRRTDVRVVLESRVSRRVPFGTGPEVARIMTLNHPETEYTYYAVANFVALRSWLQHVGQFVERRNIPSDVHPTMIEALGHLGIDTLCSHLSRQKLYGALGTQAVHQWFDAFRTLKAIRYLQQHFFPAQPLNQSLQQAPFR